MSAKLFAKTRKLDIQLVASSCQETAISPVASPAGNVGLWPVAPIVSPAGHVRFWLQPDLGAKTERFSQVSGSNLVLPLCGGHTKIKALDVPGGVSWEEREGTGDTVRSLSARR